MKLVIVDGSNVCYSFMHATQYKVSMMLGLPSIIGSIYKKHRPDIILIAWESVSNFREDLVDDYKSDRSGMPDDIYTDCIYARQILKEFGIIHVTSQGFEADDVIATLVRKFNNSEDISSIIVVSEDKDTCQCLHSAKVVIVAGKSKLGRPNGFITKDKFIDNFGFHPRYFAFYQMLIGDKSDSVSGVTNVGPKMANSFLKGLGLSTTNRYVKHDGSPEWEILEKAIDNDRVIKRIQECGIDYVKKQWELVKLHDDINLDFDYFVHKNTLKSIIDVHEFHDKMREYGQLFDNYTRNLEKIWLAQKKILES